LNLWIVTSLTNVSLVVVLVVHSLGERWWEGFLTGSIVLEWFSDSLLDVKWVDNGFDEALNLWVITSLTNVSLVVVLVVFMLSKRWWEGFLTSSIVLEWVL